MPATMPISASRWPTRRVRIPSRNRPSKIPVANDAIARALLTTLSWSRVAPKATAICTMPQSTVSTLEIRSSRRSSVQPEIGR